jgi:hypothetical protein
VEEGSGMGFSPYGDPTGESEDWESISRELWELAGGEGGSGYGAFLSMGALLGEPGGGGLPCSDIKF